MGSTSAARPPASRLARPDARPILVTILVTVWILLSGFGALRALVHLGQAATTSALRETDPAARIAAAAPDLVTDETRQLLAQREQRAALERRLAIPLLLVATLGVVGAVGLLKRRAWSRSLLVAVGLLAIGLSVFHASRSIAISSAPATDLAGSDQDAANAVALLRASVYVVLAVQSIPLVLAMAFLRHPIVRDYIGPPGERRLPEDARSRALLAVAGSAVLVAAAAFLYSKSRSNATPKEKASAVEQAPGPSETFVWDGQPIAFSAPSRAWTRERHAEGRRRGVQFTRYAAPPSRIIVAEASLEAPAATVEEVLPRLRLTEKQFRFADSVTVGEPARAVVAGLPAYQTDYSLRERSMQHRGREFFTVAGGHAFVFTFLGRDTDLPVLENLVASVRFPEAGGPEATVRTTTEETPRDEKVSGDVTDIRVGEHRVTVRVPRKWERIDYGQRQEFRHGEARIALVDGGELPAGAEEVDDDRQIERALRLFDHDPRRWTIAAKTRLKVGPREALAVDTWDPLSHVFHARTVLFVNAGRLLVAGTPMGTTEATKGPLDALVRSVRFPDAHALLRCAPSSGS